MSISITVNGFKSRQEALEFMSWYWDQGEQDASIWFENSHMRDPENIRSSLYVKNIDKENLIMNMRED